MDELQELRRQNDELRGALRELDELRHRLKDLTNGPRIPAVWREVREIIAAMKKPCMVLYQHKVAENEPTVSFNEAPTRTCKSDFRVTLSDDYYEDECGIWPKKDPPACPKCGCTTKWEQVFIMVEHPVGKRPYPRCTECNHLDYPKREPK
jgi:hypothetical protein